MVGRALEVHPYGLPKPLNPDLRAEPPRGEPGAGDLVVLPLDGQASGTGLYRAAG